ncbi:MAG: fatty acid desaturase [Bacteroidota bacterium]
MVSIGIEKEIKESLKNWRKIVKQYQVPNTKKALLQLGNSFVPFLGIWVLMYFTIQWSYTLTLFLALVDGFLLARIFIIQHDCGHHSFVKSKSWNNKIGVWCSIFTSIPYKYWARVHSFHHGHSGQLEHRDFGDINFLTVKEYRELPLWRKFTYRVFRAPLFQFVMVPIIYLGISNRIPLVAGKGWKKTSISQILNNVLILGVYALLGYLIGWKTFLFIQLSIVFFFGAIAFWFFYVQHQHEEAYKEWRENWDYLVASIKGSTYYKLPRLFQWLTGNIGFHHIHHLSPRIPNYNLEKCAKENPILQKYVTILTFKESLKCIYHKLWDEDSKRMITFWEFRRNEKVRKASDEKPKEDAEAPTLVH